MYSVKEAFYTLQGEGAQAGRASVFCRFTGCNLWSGRERDRANSRCTFCDTDFVGTDGQNGGQFVDAVSLASHLQRLWPELANGKHSRYVVFTGGEPLLQLDAALIEAMHAKGFEIAVETNGTLPAPDGIDWICVSPKGDTTLRQTQGDELKLVYPQAGVDPETFAELNFTHFFLQPMDLSSSATPSASADAIVTNGSPMEATVEYCLRHPQWRLSLQTHKIAGID